LNTLQIKLEPEIENLLAGLREAGGKPLLVGGWVRDALMGVTSHDIDIEVFGLEPEPLKRTLENFGQVFAVGVSFGVLKVRLGQGVTLDVTLPRRESRQGPRGLLFTPDPAMTPREAASRRDFTINAMAFDPASGELLDFFNGQQDLKDGILRHVGPAFGEDPLRVLRGMQFAARWNFRLAPETCEFCAGLRSEYPSLAGQRIWGEWQKLLAKGRVPSAGLAVLEQTGWRSLYPDLEILAALPERLDQPQGQTVWQHTLDSLDRAVEICERDQPGAAEREILMLAVLCHEFGKPRRPRSGWIAGEPPPAPTAAQVETVRDQTEKFLQSIDCPHYLAYKVIPLAREHLAHRMEGNENPDAAKVRHLAQRLFPASIEQWERLVQICANTGGELRGERPGLAWLELAQALGCAEHPVSPILLGRHLLEAGLKPGKQFRGLLDLAYAAQLDGLFENEAGAREWLAGQLPPPPTPSTENAAGEPQDA
jgi:tRNA nucleotidyltransferase (CCA-adding enzyme)